MTAPEPRDDRVQPWIQLRNAKPQPPREWDIDQAWGTPSNTLVADVHINVIMRYGCVTKSISALGANRRQ